MRTVRIVPDSGSEDPREWDTCGNMVCWHSRYSLGDKHGYDCNDFIKELACEASLRLEYRIERMENDVWTRLFNKFADGYPDTLEGRNDCRKRVDKLVDDKITDITESVVRANYIVLPLYFYDHSGITISASQHACSWDSGQIGYIFCDKETIDEEFDGDWGRAEKALESEVTTYDKYISGDVYGFIVEEDGEHVDSCFGFYGSDVKTNGMADYLPADDLELAEFDYSA